MSRGAARQLRSAFGHVVLVVLATAGVSCVSRRAPPEPPVPSLRWVADPASPGQVMVEVRDVDWQEVGARVFGRALIGDDAPAAWLLRVYASPASGAAAEPGDGLPAMLGTYEMVQGEFVRLRPRFALEPGVQYVAVLDLRSLPDEPGVFRGIATATYTAPPRPDSPPTVVSRVYPSADELPENLLKFYVHFSGPMSRGGVYRHARLLDDSKRAVELPFLELDEELWDPEMTRLTLFIDPGRIKRGVRPLEEIGPALEQGKRYTLVVDRGLVDARGRGLGEEFRKSFTVGPPDREAPDPAKWTVTPPAASTRGPLTIEFPDPMDHALAERLIRVTAGGNVVPGEVSLGANERRWTFAPNEPWGAGRYEIVVQPTVEDLAGNNIGKPFEVDLQDDGKSRPDLAPVRLPVDVR